MNSLAITRRHFFGRSAIGIGAIVAWPDSGGESAIAAAKTSSARKRIGLASFSRQAQNESIYLFQSGGPSHLDLFDYKPLLNKLNGEQLPASCAQGPAAYRMSANQSSIPLAGFDFQVPAIWQVGYVDKRIVTENG